MTVVGVCAEIPGMGIAVAGMDGGRRSGGGALNFVIRIDMLAE